jgi:hypothetical protein
MGRAILVVVEVHMRVMVGISRLVVHVLFVAAVSFVSRVTGVDFRPSDCHYPVY